MFLEGYGEQILNGTWLSIKLATFSLLFALVLGLLGALAKLFGNGFFRACAQAYTTLIRSVPDLVLMLLIFSKSGWSDAITWARLEKKFPNSCSKTMLKSLSLEVK